MTQNDKTNTKQFNEEASNTMLKNISGKPVLEDGIKLLYTKQIYWTHRGTELVNRKLNINCSK
jgi:hypothetical protein